MAPAKTAHFSQKELVFSSLGYTFTDHFSFQYTTSIPILFGGGELLNILSFKGAGRVNKKFAIGGRYVNMEY